MSAWRLLIREIHLHGPMHGTVAQSSEIYRAQKLGLIEHDEARRWRLTPLGIQVCEGSVTQIWWRPGGHRWVATWLRALPRGLRIGGGA